jgi:hypothetical protein
LKATSAGITVKGSGLENFERRCEAINIIECMIEKATGLAGSDAFAAVLIKISTLYKYVGLFV